jgi:hypothetical protein
MFAKRIGAIVFIFLCTSFAWAILGGVTEFRTTSQDTSLRAEVGELWGTSQKQSAPKIYDPKGHKLIAPMKNDIAVALELDYRKKGLLWYSTYRVEFEGNYVIENDAEEGREIYFQYQFPTDQGIYDNFQIAIDGETIKDVQPSEGEISHKINFDPGASRTVKISYGSQGTDEWWYVFGENVSQLHDFTLTMNTDFDGIDFPDRSISPTDKRKTDNGWELVWQYDNLISGIQIGMAMPHKLNPGPFVSRLTFFAPVSLFLFLFLMFIITTVKNVNIHPLNYFFISAAFFSFHLLMAYLVDHIDIHLAFIICSAVSIFLVISYMRLVVGTRFAWIQTGLSQFVYLVLFSYAFFLEGFTGLAITICCILTLFVVMQFTGKIDWSKQLANGRRAEK